MIDLSTSAGLAAFIDLYSTQRGRWLANRFNLSGKGSEKLARNVSAFVWNARALEVCVTDNAKNIYSDACFIILEDIVSSPLFHALRYRFKFPPLARYKCLAQRTAAPFSPPD